MNWKLKYGLVGVVLGIIILGMSIFDAIGFLKEPIKVDSISKIKSLKDGDHVTLDITMCYDCLMSETTTTEKNGSVQSSKESARYYIIPFVEDHIYFLTVKVKPEDFSKIESAFEPCYKYLEQYTQDSSAPKPTEVFLTVDGLIKNMKDEEKKFITDFTGYINPIYVNIPNKSTSFIITGLGLLFIAVSAVFIVLYFVGRKKEKARLEEMRLNNPGYYEAPQNITFNNSAVNNNMPPFGTYPQDTYPVNPVQDPTFPDVPQNLQDIGNIQNVQDPQQIQNYENTWDNINPGNPE